MVRSAQLADGGGKSLGGMLNSTTETTLSRGDAVSLRDTLAPAGDSS